MDWLIWAPVAAALGASALTGWVSLRVIAVQRRYLNEDAQADERARAYDEFMACALHLVFRAGLAGIAARERSGIQEGLMILLYRRKPADPFEIMDWMHRDLRPLNQAWSKIHAVGSQEAVDAADEVMEACAAYMGAATSPDRTQPPLLRALVGQQWSPQKVAEVEALSKKVFEARERFVNVVRAETGREPVMLPITRRTIEEQRRQLGSA